MLAMGFLSLFTVFTLGGTFGIARRDFYSTKGHHSSLEIQRFLHPEHANSMKDFDEALDATVKSDQVVVLSKTKCPFSAEAVSLLKELNNEKTFNMSVYQLDTTPEMSQFQDAMKRRTGVRSVPGIFVRSKYIGGHDDIFKLAKSGELQKKLQVVKAAVDLGKYPLNPSNPHSSSSNAASTMVSKTGKGSSRSAGSMGAITLDSSNFDQYLATKDAVLVDFYKEGCHSCEHLAPAVDAAAQMVSDNPKVAIVKVDGTGRIGERYASLVEFFPTLVMFRQGMQPQTYEDAKNAQSMAKSVLSQQ
eukprot:jgi/Bigna1/86888/estExt_fgenesh1_pg.C_140218